MATEAPLDPLAAAIAKQEELLQSMQHAHGEFHVSVADDLAQLATLYNMRGDHARALTLLHKRLVIHEKHGPAERVGETLHSLGTTYRLQGLLDLAQQHLERALATRTSSHGDRSFQAAETLNSLALLYQSRNDNDEAEAWQLQSLQVLLESDEPVDMESEDVPWEVYKRLKQQRGPSTAANSLTLLKGTLRSCVNDALAAADGNNDAATSSLDKSVAFVGLNSPRSPRRTPSPLHALAIAGRSARAKSDSAMLHLRVARDAADDLDTRLVTVNPPVDNAVDGPLSPVPSLRRKAPVASPIPDEAPITDATALLARVESLKRRVVAGASDVDLDIARLATDVGRLPVESELRSMGDAMVGLVREMQRMRTRLDGDSSDRHHLPVLEGHVEKKSASIFRGFERRFFAVDPKTFILSYHFSRDDYARGFAPRGGFPIARIANIVVHRPSATSGNGTAWFYFDVVVDLSTRHHPHATRTYELRVDTADARRYWVETLHLYRATAQQSTSGRPKTS